MPVVDRAANAAKAQTDRLARQLLQPDRKKQRQMLASLLSHFGNAEDVRLYVTGGAGSGKTTASKKLGEELGLPVFDFDQYIPGGFTADQREYDRRFLKGMTNLWDDLPTKTGWVVEHVESCCADMLHAFKPTHALLIEPPAKDVLQVASARSAASGEEAKDAWAREKRALESAEYARMQFENVPGNVVAQGTGWKLKKVS